MEDPVLDRAKDRYESENPDSNFEDQSTDDQWPYIQEAIDQIGDLALTRYLIGRYNAGDPIFSRVTDKYESENPGSHLKDLDEEDLLPYVKEAIDHQRKITNETVD